MLCRAFRNYADRISMLVAVIVVMCALLWDEGGVNFQKLADSTADGARFMAVDSPLVRIESTDEVYGAILQEAIVRRFSVQNVKSRAVRAFFYAILDLLLAAVAIMLLQEPLRIWLHRSQRVIVSYIHDQDGQK